MFDKVPTLPRALIRSVMIFSYMLPQTLLDSTDMQSIADFIVGWQEKIRDESSSEAEETAFWRLYTYGVFIGLSVVGAALLAYIIWTNTGKKDLIAEADERALPDPEAEPTLLPHLELSIQDALLPKHAEHGHGHGHSHGHGHGIAHHLMDILVIGTPFALISMAGVFEFMELYMPSRPIYTRWITAGLLGTFCGLGTTFIHSRHAHDDGEEDSGFLKSLKRTYYDNIRNAENKRHAAKQIYFKSGIVLGHFLEGWYAVDVFLAKTGLDKALPVPLSIIFKLVLSSAVVAIEANSEGRSIDIMHERAKALSDDVKSQVNSLFKKLAAWTGGIHALPNAITLSILIDDLCGSEDGHAFASILPFEEEASKIVARILLFSAVYAWLGVSNAYGFYNLVLEAPDTAKRNKTSAGALTAAGTFKPPGNDAHTGEMQSYNTFAPTPTTF